MVMIDLAPPRHRRPTTLSTRRMKKDRLAAPSQTPVQARTSSLLTIIDDDRPRTRAECRAGPRPCLYVSCRFHLYLDVNEHTGSIKLNFPDKEVWELCESCSLDIAERGGLTLDEFGALLNVTRERARQLEEAGLEKIAAKV